MLVKDHGGLNNKIPEELTELVVNGLYAVMSTIRHSDGMISSNPVSYTYDGDVFRISTLKSRVKYHNLIADSRLTLCIVSQQDMTVYVEIRGHATIEDDPDRRFLKQQFRKSMGVDPPEDLDPPGAQRVIVTLHPEQVSAPTLYGGRFARKS